MGRIAVLDRNMINMIAAGEVIERPANVVKELMENSIDAGATKIVVSVEDGGRKLISVTDNGCGMDADDVKRAFQTHTTSKIKTSSDLQQISTLGFRGEALASIASIAQVKAASRTENQNAGNCIEIDCGEQINFAPCSTDYGTKVDIRDIFYKLPARRKFLKTANTEMGHITEQFTRIALANNHLDMTLERNGKEVYRLTANQNLKQRIAELFSPEISENLLEVETREKSTQQSDEKGLHIFALLGKPKISRTNNKFQYVFLNGRYIRDKFVSHAIREAYRGSIDPDRYAVAFIYIHMPAEEVDLNVHPTKIEVRFYNANLIHSQILGCIREKLLSTNLDVHAKLPVDQHRRREIADAMAEFFKKHKTAHTQQQLAFHPSGNLKTACKNLNQQPFNISQESREHANLLLQKKFIQIHNSFIIAEIENGFVIVDQHALQERIIYEDLCKRIKEGKLESQKLLIPESFELSDARAEILNINSYILEKLGVEIVPFGPGSYAVQSFPTLLSKIPPVDFITDLIDLLDKKEAAVEPESLIDKILEMAACKAAIKAGQRLSDPEIEQLLSDKQRLENQSRCPHGRPTTIKFSLTELEKQFKRT